MSGEGGDRSGRVVLVHGFTQTGRSWWKVGDDLARDHVVVAVDAPGHGTKAGVEVDLWGAAGLLGDEGGRAAYVGYSMGGRICLHLALARPDLVERLVLIGATAGIEAPDARAARARSDESLASQLAQVGVEAFLARWMAQPLLAGLADDAAGLEARRQNSAAGLASSLRLAGTGAQEPLWGRLHRLEMPVLVVAGERDEKFAALGRRMAASIGPNARLAVVGGAGHAVHLERPDAFLALVRPFLATRPGVDG